MASNYTDLLGLCQWAAEDSVLFSEFNADNKKIDDYMKKLPQMAYGKYTGSGVYGVDSPCTLYLTFTPRLVIIAIDDGGDTRPGAIFIHGQERCAGMGLPGSVNDGLHLALEWGDYTITWYCYSQTNSSAANQLNKSGMVYRYFVLGD